MTPQFVEAHLCGGGCHTPSHSCVSTSRVSRQIPVLLSQCGLSAGLCSKSCATITIEEDTSCQCDCLQEQKICANVRHSFNRRTCSCECQVEEEYTLCRDQGRVWDNEECVCRCPVEMVKPCSTGMQQCNHKYFTTKNIYFLVRKLKSKLQALHLTGLPVLAFPKKQMTSQIL